MCIDVIWYLLTRLIDWLIDWPADVCVCVPSNIQPLAYRSSTATLAPSDGGRWYYTEIRLVCWVTTDKCGRTLCTSKPPVLPQLGGGKQQLPVCLFGKKIKSPAEKHLLLTVRWHAKHGNLCWACSTPLKREILWPECQATHVQLIVSPSMRCSFWGDVGDWWIFFKAASNLHQITLISSPLSGHLDQFLFIVLPSSVSLC